MQAAASALCALRAALVNAYASPQLRALSGSTPCEVNKKDGQPKLTVLTIFGGPSGGRTLDLGIKSLERDVMECLVAAKSQVVMFPHALTALKLHCRTDIDGYPAMHKAPPRQFMPGRGCIYQFLKSFWLPTRTIAHPRRPVSSPAAAPTIKQISNGFICTPIDRVA